MFSWYQGAQTCYAYLEDVRHSSSKQGEGLKSSRWFKRGWTLQELIAPRALRFFDAQWQPMGYRDALAGQLARITGIAADLLSGPHLSILWALREYSVAQRMSWAANRQTTRPEDRAYSLLGLLGVSMPLLYGEGLHAFRRLQEEVIMASSDLSIFAWGTSHRANASNLLAETPDDFQGCGDVVVVGRSNDNTKPFLEGEASLTNLAVHLVAPVLVVNHGSATVYQQLAMSLQCRRKGDITNIFALKLTPNPGRVDSAMGAMRQSTIEAMCGVGSERIVFVDAISAEENSETKSIVLRRAADQFAFAGRGAMFAGVRTLDYIWVRSSPTNGAHHMESIHANPPAYWTLPSRCFDIQAIRDDQHRMQKLKSSGSSRVYGDSTRSDVGTASIHASITLRIDDLSEIIVAFIYFNGQCDFSLAWSTPALVTAILNPKPDFDVFRRIVNNPCHILKTDDHRAVHIDLHRRNIFEESVGIFEISVLPIEDSGHRRHSANVKE